MRVFRLMSLVALGGLLASPVAAQIISRGRAQGSANTAPRLIVTNPLVFTSADSAASVAVGQGLRERMKSVVGRDFRTVERDRMNEALATYGYPPDAILGPAAARRFAGVFQARMMLSSTLARAEGGRYSITARLAGLNAEAGNVVSMTQAPGQSLEKFGEQVADAFRSAVKSSDEAKACVDQRTTRPDKAAEEAEKALRETPNDGLAEFCLAQLAQDRKQPSDSIIAHLKRAVKGDPLSLPAWTLLATQYEQRADSAGVIDAFQQMLVIAPTNQPLREAAFQLFLRYGRPEAARDVAEAGLKLDPTNADLYDLLSNACIFTGDYGCAVDALEQVYQNDSTKADTTFYLKITTVAGTKPDTTRLLDWARRGVNKYPRNTDLLDFLATGYRLNGQLDSMVAVTNRLLAIDSTRVTAALSAAQALAEAGRVKDAVPFTDFAVAHGDASVKQNVAAILVRGALPLLQQQPQDLEGAAMLTRRAVAAADSSEGNAYALANYLLGLATFLQVPKLDKQAEAQKSCDIARQMDGLLQEAETAFGLGRSSNPEQVDKNMEFLKQYKKRVASMVKAYCK